MTETLVVKDNLGSKELRPFLLLNSDLRIQYFNQAAQELITNSFGRAELKSGDYIYNYLPKAATINSVLLELLCTKSSKEFNLELSLPNSNVKSWYQFQLEPLFSSQPYQPPKLASIALTIVALGTSAQDETIKDAEQDKETLEKQKLIERIIKLAPNRLFYIYDLIEHRVVYINQAVSALLGYTPEQVQHRETDFFEKILLSTKLAQHKTLAEAFKHIIAQDTVETTSRVQHANGYWRWLHSWEAVLERTTDGLPKQIVVVAEDVTALKLAEEALDKSETRFSKIFNSAPLPLAITTLEEGRFIEVNESFVRTTGFSREESIGATNAMVWPNLETQHNFLQVFKLEGQVRNYETEFHTKLGEVKHCLTSCELIEFDAAPCLLIMFIDFTERKQVEEELRMKEQELEKRVSEQTKELTSLLQVSHDVALILDTKPLATLILEQLKRMVDYSSAAIFTWLEDGGKPSRNFQLLEKNLSAADESLFNYIDSPDFITVLCSTLLSSRALIATDSLDDSVTSTQLRLLLGKRRQKFLKSARSWLVVSLSVKGQLIGVFILTHTQPNYYTVHHANLTIAIADQAAVALENAWLYKQAGKAAVLEERQRLARELHDSVSQVLYSILLGTQAAQRELESVGLSSEAQFTEQLQYIFSLAQAGLEEMRALLFELRPEALAEEGLVIALQKQAASLRLRHQLKIKCTLIKEPNISLKIKEALYRVAQEALLNIIKHARATQVEIHLSVVKGEGSKEAAITLEIKDNGRGFNPLADFPGHFGLRSMKERLNILGGSLEIESTPGYGTTIYATVPLNAAQH